MRRKEREITSKEKMLDIMKRCEVCHLAFHTEDDPYVIPMNFGMDVENETPILYFHCAGEGTKIDLIKRDPRAAFSMEADREVVKGASACSFTMYYESVCGKGELHFVTDRAEKEKALECLMKQYAKEEAEPFVFEENVLERITILKFSVKEMTGKSNKPGNLR